MLTISYAILCNDEINELTLLLNFLILHIRQIDEVCILVDNMNDNQEMIELLKEFEKKFQINKLQFKWDKSPLNYNFANQKNILNKMCKGDYIFNIDADEIIGETFITQLPQLLEMNKINEVYIVPRINIVEGITQSHIQKWSWNVSKNEKFINEKIIDTNSDEYKLLKYYNLIIEENEI